MNSHYEPSSGEDSRMSDFSEIIALIFVTIVIVGSVIGILFY